MFIKVGSKFDVRIVGSMKIYVLNYYRAIRDKNFLRYAHYISTLDKSVFHQLFI